MKQLFKNKSYVFLSILWHMCTICTVQSTVPEKPKLTVVIVVDQLPFWQFQRLSPYFKYGFKKLIKEGINYQNMYFPHARSSTSPGHTGMQTGTYPKDHGMINNCWFAFDGTRVQAFEDSSPQAAVLNPLGGTFTNKGYSAHHIMVNGISDQFMLESRIEVPHHVFSVSLKPRSAIATTSKLGKAIWFDIDAGLFTSSKAYFNALPEWLTKFNAQHYVLHKKDLVWNLAYPNNFAAYQFHNSRTYQFVRDAKSLVNRKIPLQKICSYKHPNHCQPMFLLTPFANQLILDLAEECIHTTVSKTKPDQLLLWVCLTAPDKLGHKYGPDSRETIDMIYHLDKQLGNFMKKVQKYLDPSDVLFILTSDHGTCPIPELMHNKGFPNARRIITSDLIAKINAMLAQRYEGTNNLVTNIKLPSLYLNNNQFNQFTTKEQQEILNTIKEFLEAQPGIKKVWTAQELNNSWYKTNDLENFFKTQLFPGRSGPIQIQAEPYCFLTELNTGTEHQSPYEYDTHVPFIFYRQDVYQPQTIPQKGWVLQLANTLAEILGVQKPSASVFSALPPFNGQNQIPTVNNPLNVNKKEIHESN